MASIGEEKGERCSSTPQTAYMVQDNFVFSFWTARLFSGSARNRKQLVQIWQTWQPTIIRVEGLVKNTVSIDDLHKTDAAHEKHSCTFSIKGLDSKGVHDLIRSAGASQCYLQNCGH